MHESQYQSHPKTATDNMQSNASTTPSTSTENTSSSVKTSLSIQSQSNSATSKVVLLPTAVVYVAVQSKLVLARVMLDSGSQASLINESFLSKHRLPTTTNLYSPVTISGITGNSTQSNSITSIKLISRKEAFEISILTLILSVKYHSKSKGIQCVKLL